MICPNCLKDELYRRENEEGEEYSECENCNWSCWGEPDDHDYKLSNITK